METMQCDIHMTGEHVIVSRGAGSLWCSRSDGSLKPGSVVTPDNLQSARYLGKCYGLVGKIQFFSGSEWKLLLIGSIRSVGSLPLCGQVYCIERLIIIPLTTDASPEILGLERDSVTAPVRKGSSGRPDGVSGGGGGGSKLREGKEKDKLERRLMEALLRMFNDSHSFYFSVEGDITHTQQRKMTRQSTTDNSSLPLWKTVDERFFWNKWMLQDLLDITCQSTLVEPWILPVIQGYVEIHTLVLHSTNPPDVLQVTRRPSVRSWPGEAEGNRVEAGKKDEEEEEEKDMILFSPKLDSSPSALLAVVRRDGSEEGSSRGEPSGYESDSSEGDSQSSSACVADGEGVEGRCESCEKEELGEGRERLEGSTEGVSITLTEPVRHGERVCVSEQLSGDSFEVTQSVTVEAQLSEESVEVKQSTEGVREKGRERRPFLERLKLVRRSSSPDRGGREEGDSGASSGSLVQSVKRGLQSLNSDRLAVVGKHEHSDTAVSESGEFGEGSAVGETGEDEGEDTERYGESEEESRNSYSFKLALVSRRSRHRAGTRYRRRGVDALGNVANFVETEMILQAGTHHASYILVRGSVPVYWTQPGTKYRPPPIIERGEEETQEAFKKHFEQQFSLYNHVAITSLINQSGRESVLGETFEKHILSLDSPDITYVTFDFHRHFKADPNGAIERLVDATRSLSKKFRFCWVDTNIPSGPLCRQDGVFRVNCMDCLDRTNVVQTAFCKEVLQSALQKLGIIPFDEHLDGAMLTTYKLMWANNGDFISRQYTGTDAMKGDLTRYGERKFSGMMKDGYNSAHRYYQNLFRDSYRQVLIDLMQGCPHSDAFSSLPPSLRGQRGGEGEEEEELWSLDREQAVAEMVQLCREELFPTKTLTVVGWALVEAAGYSFVDSSRKEEDCVMLQCREQNQLCVASYNVEDDQVNCFIRIPMEKIEKIVVGPLGTVLRSSQKRLHLRLYYTLMGSRQCYFTLKTVNFTSMEEDRDILLGIASTLSHICPTILIQEQKLTKKRSPAHLGVIHLVMPKELASEVWNEEAPSLQADQNTPFESAARNFRGNSFEEEEETVLCEVDEDDDNERELSLSMPASPTLPHRPPPLPPSVLGHPRVQRLHSQSFDDIISGVNNEEGLSPTDSVTRQNSATHIASARNLAFETSLPPDFGSDSGTEHVHRHGLGTAYESPQLVRSQPDMALLGQVSGSAVASGVGRLNQLRGRLLGRVRRGRGGQKTESLEVPLQPMRPRSHHITSDSSPDCDLLGKEATPDPEGDTAATSAGLGAQHQVSLVTQGLLAVGQRFRNAPPSLLRRMGVAGGQDHMTQATPTTLVNESVKDTKTSKTNFITL